MGHTISSLELSCPADIETIQTGHYGLDAFIHTHRHTSPHIHLPEFTGEVFKETEQVLEKDEKGPHNLLPGSLSEGINQ